MEELTVISDTFWFGKEEAVTCEEEGEEYMGEKKEKREDKR